MLPICCYNCGKCIAKYEEIFEKLAENNKDENLDKILDKLKINKLCCRVLFLSYINECRLLVK